MPGASFGQKTVGSPATIPDEAANTTDPKVLRHNTLQQGAMMQDKVSHTFPKQNAKYQMYLDKKGSTLPTPTLRPQAYMKRSPFSLIA